MGSGSSGRRPRFAGRLREADPRGWGCRWHLDQCKEAETAKHFCTMAFAVPFLLPSLSTRAGDLQLHMISFAAFLYKRNFVSPAHIIFFQDLQVLFVTCNFYPWKIHLFGQFDFKKKTLKLIILIIIKKMAGVHSGTHHVKLPVTFTTNPKHNLLNTIKANICQLLR